MYTLHIKKQLGIALVQVLIISIILTMLGIYITQAVKVQIGSTQLMQKSFEATLAGEIAQAELLHVLLTNKRLQNKSSSNSIVQNWNFYGKPFRYDEFTEISIQDLSSLLSVNFTNKTLLSRFFEQLGKKEKETRTFIDALSDWKDIDDLKRLNGAEKDYYQSVGLKIPRNDYLQNISEISNVKQSNILSKRQWDSYFTILLSSKFNPLNSPHEILKAFINNDQALTEVIKQRNNGTLSTYSFYQATGIESDEQTTFYTGRVLKIKIATTKQNSQFSKSFIVDLRPNAPLRALTISNVIWDDE